MARHTAKRHGGVHDRRLTGGPELDSQRSTMSSSTKAVEQNGTTTAWATLGMGAFVFVAALLWSYWPTLVEMVRTWNREPDYSHGYLVLPFALFFLWSRRKSFPHDSIRTDMWGAVLLFLASALRVAAGMYYLLPLDGWTLPLTVAGAVWVLFGRSVLWWSLPAIVFVYFMIPIPYSAERWLSVPLQAVTTSLSTAVLVMFGQPAIAEGNVILLGDHELFVAEACSGMRIFVGILALAFAFALFSRWSWWQRVLVLVVALPVAIVANVTRVVITGLLTQTVSSEAGHRFSHDVAGFVVIPFAAALFWLFLFYLERLFPEVEDVTRPVTLNSAAGTS